jgi:hypothetical protein
VSTSTRTAPTLIADPRRRGTRGFAAFTTFLAGAAVLGIGLVALPAASIDPTTRNILVIPTVAFGIAHMVAVVGLIRGRAWSGRLVAYLADIGIGVAAYGILVTLTRLDPIGATSSLPAGVAKAQGLGLMIWMIGLWAVAARFAWRGTRQTVQTGWRARAGATAAAA